MGMGEFYHCLPFPVPNPIPTGVVFVCVLMTDWWIDFKPSFDERHTVYRSMTDWRLNFSNSLYRELVGLCCLVMSRYQSLRHQSVIKVLCVWITADDGLKSVHHCIILLWRFRQILSDRSLLKVVFCDHFSAKSRIFAIAHLAETNLESDHSKMHRVKFRAIAASGHRIIWAEANFERSQQAKILLNR